VTADHLGAGGSSHPEDEALLTADAVVGAMSRAVAAARDRLGVAGLPSVGVGHSMGSGFTLYQHDRHHDHDALALFGWSNIALLVPGRDGVRRPVGAPGSGANMRLHNFAPDTPDELVAASRAIATVMPEPALRWLIAEPGRLAAAAGRVEVPVFLGHGARDVTPDPEGDAALYRRAPSVTSHVLAGSHHFLHDRPDRHELWDAFLAWTDRLDRDEARQPGGDGTAR
jgi:pimeloyl-ACP methyl ester carboxylesterase